VNSFATADKILLLGIGQKGLILQIATFQIFVSVNNQCQPTILGHCIDHCKHNLYKIVSCPSDLVFFLSYRHKKSTL